MDEGFGNGFEQLIEQTTTTFTHSNLILGHSYTYRVKASNFLGYGAYSTLFSFTPITAPGKPPSAPQNIPSSTTRNVIYISYNPIT